MNFGTEIPEDDSARVGLLDRVSVPWHVALGAQAADTFVHNPLNLLSSASELFMANHPDARGGYAPLGMSEADPQFASTPAAPVPAEQDEFADPKTLNAQYGQSLGLTFDQPTRKGAVSIIVRRKQEEIARNAAIDRAPGGFTYGAASLGTQLAVSAVDPLNVASAFIPVVGEARAAIWAERYGKTLGRVLTGAVEGAVGGAMIEPVNYGASKYLGDDYTMGDSLMNIGLGGVLGGGLHAGFGLVTDRLARAAPETREAALRGAVANMAEGRPVEIDHILATDPRWQAPDHEIDPFAGSAFPDAPSMMPQPADLESAAADVARARAPLPKDSSLFQTIKDMGGMSLHDAAGSVTREGTEVRAVLKDIKRPGLISKKGLTPDYMREALRERGWFGVREDQGADIQHLYDALGREAGGEKVYHPDSPIHDELRGRAGLDEELGRAGVLAADSPDAAAEKLAKWRVAASENEGSALHYWRSKADELGLEHRATDTPEDIMASVIEAQAIRAERNGNLGAFADDAEARLREHMDRLYPDLKDADLEREFQDQEQRGASGGFAPESRFGQDAQDQGRFGGDGSGAGNGREGQDASAGLDRARTASMAYGRGEELSTAINPDTSANGDRIVREARGDDLDVEHAEALATIDAFEKQGALTPEEAAEARSGSEDIKKARQNGDAARAAARCLLLHP